MDLSINFFGEKLKNPLFLPSGIVTDIPSHINAIRAGAGLVVLKSITLKPRVGNPLPRIVKFSSGFLNSVGLTNPGLKEGIKQISQLMKKSTTPLVVSIFSTSIKEFVVMAEEILEIKPFALELNLSCPNLRHETNIIISHQGKSSFEAVRAVKRLVGKMPVFAKLSPNVENISEIAKWCQEGGADAISAINTVAPAMVIDIKKKQPMLGAKVGGVSGPAIKPIAIRCVYEIYQAVNIPIIGMGGVTSWQDAVEMMMAGATLVGVGSAVYLKGWAVYQQIIEGIKKFLKRENFKEIKSLIGLAHQN
ncbi:MAG: dihydroorotate dehydrogenase [Microgenomates group bacterium]